MTKQTSEHSIYVDVSPIDKIYLVQQRDDLYKLLKNPDAIQLPRVKESIKGILNLIYFLETHLNSEKNPTKFDHSVEVSFTYTSDKEDLTPEDLPKLISTLRKRIYQLESEDPETAIEAFEIWNTLDE